MRAFIAVYRLACICASFRAAVLLREVPKLGGVERAIVTMLLLAIFGESVYGLRRAIVQASADVSTRPPE